MTYKQTAVMNKPWEQTESFGFSPSGLIAKLINAVKLDIPVGYQDQNGFHHGVKPASQDENWPSVW